MFPESAKGAAARRQPSKEHRRSWGGALDTATVLRVFPESAKSAAARRPTSKEHRRSWGGALDTATVLRVFPESAKGAAARRQTGKEHLRSWGGALDTATVLRVFPESGHGVIKVLLAEDQTIVRRGIAALLALTEDIRVTAEASDGAEALTAATTADFDVALLDIRMPRLSGTQVIKEWAGMGKPIPAILLTTFDEDGLFLEAVQAGAHGFLLKDVSLERLAEAVRAVARGERLFQPVLTERVVRVIREMGGREKGTPFEAIPSPETLTPRERDILRLIAAGYSNREIASVLRMSEGAVKNHTSSILSKLGARDRTRAVLRGIERGLV